MSACRDEGLRLDALDICRIRADNPGPLTLSGTNTWIVGREPAYVIDPGPASEEHLTRVIARARERGGLGAVLLTHDHPDHAESVSELRARLSAPLAGARGDVDIRLGEGTCVGPLRALCTPGHAPDHVALLFGRACFTGDAVLGQGSVFIAADPGALAGYLKGLKRLRGLDLDVLCPGHGPAVWDPRGKLEECLAHREQRERRLVDALAEGRRGEDDLLDAAWSEVPQALRPVAAFTLAAHLDKLEDEGRLPAGMPRRA